MTKFRDRSTLLLAFFLLCAIAVVFLCWYEYDPKVLIWGCAPLGREALEIGRYGEEREQVALLRLGEMVGVCVNVLICRRVGCVLRRGGCLVGGGGAYLSPRASRTASVRLACRVHRGGNVR